MSEQPYYAPNRQPDTPRTKRETEHLWAIRLDGPQYDGELLERVVGYPERSTAKNYRSWAV